MIFTCSARRTFRESPEFAVFHTIENGAKGMMREERLPHFLKIMVRLNIPPVLPVNYRLGTLVGTI
jgi:hypothetical protein